MNNIYEFNLPKSSRFLNEKSFSKNKNFRGNITKPIAAFRIGSKELAQVKEISDCYRHLDLFFKAAGNKMSDLFKKSVDFLIPLAAGSFLLKNLLNSEDVQDVKLENPKEKKSDELMTFTLGGKENIAKLVVAKSGEMRVFADDELSDTVVNNYLSEIDENFDKLFNTVLDKAEIAMSSFDTILDKKYDKKIDLTKPECVKAAAELFSEERKRITVLTPFVTMKKFLPQFTDVNGGTSLNGGTLKDKDIKFSFLNIENQYFKGINLTVTDTKTGTEQKFVASNDGGVYKTPTYKAGEEFFTSSLSRYLTLLTPEELNNPDLQYMFNYACEYTDLVYKRMIKEFAHGGHSKTGTLDKLNEKSKVQSKVSKEKTFAEGNSKIAKNYDLKPELMKDMEQLEDLRSRISKAYNTSFRLNESFEALEKNTGLIRKKGAYNFWLKDALSNSDMLLGISKYTFSYNKDELLSFDFCDKDFNQIARLKILENGKARLLFRLDADKKLIEEVSNIIEAELENGLTERLVPKLKEACFYHENYYDVKDYIKRSYYPITVSQAVREMMNPPTRYKMDTKEIKILKDNLDNISGIYRNDMIMAKNWQYLFGPDAPILLRNVMTMSGKLPDLAINYEAVFIDRKNISGIRVLTRDNDGKVTNVYIVSYDGDVYKLRGLTNSEIKLFNMSSTNFSQLDEEAVKAEHLDLILQNLYATVPVYNEYLKECQEKYKSQPIEYSIKQISKSGDINKKIGRPRKNPNEVVQKTIRPLVKEEKTSLVPHMSSALKNLYADMLRPSGEFKGLDTILLSDVAMQLDRIFTTPYEERSPHLIHEKLDSGRIFEGRFSVKAPDGALITVSRVKSPKYVDFVYYSIKVQKGKDVAYLNIDPEAGRIILSDQDKPILIDKVYIRHLSKVDFLAQNPICKNMSMYFGEIFDERPNTERKVIKFQLPKRAADKVEKQAMKDFERAMRMPVPEAFKKEVEAEMFDEEESEDY